MDSDQLLTRLVNSLLFETPSGERYTQDSPVLPNVWLSFGRAPLDPQELILTLKSDKPAGAASTELRLMINKLRNLNPNEPHAPDLGPVGHHSKRSVRLAYLPGQIASQLYFDELVRTVVPLTPWWQKMHLSLTSLAEKHEKQLRPFEKWRNFPLDPTGDLRHLLVDALMLMRQSIGGTVSSRQNPIFRALRALPVDFVWFVRIVGVISYLAERAPLGRWELRKLESDPVISTLVKDFRHRRFDPEGNTIDDNGNLIVAIDEARYARDCIAEAFLYRYKDWTSDPGQQPGDYYLWRATKNRSAELAVNASALTVKADAARRLFDISCKGLTWAIIDTGIDSKHPAFRDHSASTDRSRVIRTLDFTQIRDLLDLDFLSNIGPGPSSPLFERLLNNGQWGDASIADRRVILAEHLKEVERRIRRGYEIDWEFLTPLVETNDPAIPLNDHGTHVGGVLAADWAEEDEELVLGKDRTAEELEALASAPRRMQGICPDISLIDCRVFREEGDTDEFEILAAIQYLRWLNARAGFMLVHGANLSFSLVHEVRRYACGQTPICVECDEAVAVGMVMVAAAGNRGFEFSGIEETGRGARLSRDQRYGPWQCGRGNHSGCHTS